MNATDPTTGIEVLSRDECLHLLGTQTVGRVVVVDHRTPHIVPVNYALDGDAIVFRSGLGTKLDAASRSNVAFEVDFLDDIAHTAWSVVVHGWAQEVTAFDDPALLARLGALRIEPWADFEKPYVVRIVGHSITGRRIARREPKSQEVLRHA